ncbi:ADP/ATP carrier protein [Skeletonema marinoi]|uniref:ADP,ATP carrier protein n=1 Tax=Skeletonema marinoi TaxID=267567 RepID=A0AAD8YK41_9STRA|nr:ADP/ATP carrier protein [Skeletonema marinoi]
MLTPTKGPGSTALSAAARSIMNSPLLESPKAKSGVAMASAMALHFAGYELARGSNMALFTSSSLGFGSSSGGYYPLAMACASPLSMFLLLSYTRQLDRKGPRRALRSTTLLCISALTISGIAMATMQHNEVLGNIKILSLPISQIIVWASFVFQNSYAHLLYAQQWSFLGSIFTPTEAGKYYSYVAGLSSIVSMIAGTSVSRLVEWIGLGGLLGLAAASLTATLLLADWAYSTAEKHGFDPSREIQKQKKSKAQSKLQDEKQSQSTSQSTDASTEEKPNKTLLHQIREGISLFRRVPTLGALFFETLCFQSLSTILSTCFVMELNSSVPNDNERASWTGNLYATSNGLSTIFQFFLLPVLTQRMEPKHLWRLMPLLPLICGIVRMIPSLFPGALVSSSSSALYLVAISLLTAKTMDYSLRNVLAELVYVPLDFESRYVGKEIIAVFANRFGKSGMALILSGLNFIRGGSSGGGLSGLALAISFGWWGSALSLSSLIPSKQEAERMVAERDRKED